LAKSHGLNPADYFTDRIHRYWDSIDTAGLAKLDILLALGMMRYVADQQEGRMEPREVDPESFASARDVEVDWGTLGRMAFEAPDMKAFLENRHRRIRNTPNCGKNWPNIGHSPQKAGGRPFPEERF
jgi:hypothetical protein